jgi:hypothetical protein
MKLSLSTIFWLLTTMCLSLTLFLTHRNYEQEIDNTTKREILLAESRVLGDHLRQEWDFPDGYGAYKELELVNKIYFLSFDFQQNNDPANQYYAGQLLCLMRITDSSEFDDLIDAKYRSLGSYFSQNVDPLFIDASIAEYQRQRPMRVANKN